MDRPSNIRVLGSIALVLFSLNFLIFVDRNFDSDSDQFVYTKCFQGAPTAWTSAPPSSALYVFKPEHTAAQRYWSQSQRATTFITPAPARPINEELRLRAAHPSEANEALRNKLGLTSQATAHIPIMH